MTHVQSRYVSDVLSGQLRGLTFLRCNGFTTDNQPRYTIDMRPEQLRGLTPRTTKKQVISSSRTLDILVLIPLSLTNSGSRFCDSVPKVRRSRTIGQLRYSLDRAAITSLEVHQVFHIPQLLLFLCRFSFMHSSDTTTSTHKKTGGPTAPPRMLTTAPRSGQGEWAEE